MQQTALPDEAPDGERKANGGPALVLNLDITDEDVERTTPAFAAYDGA